MEVRKSNCIWCGKESTYTGAGKIGDYCKGVKYYMKCRNQHSTAMGRSPELWKCYCKLCTCTICGKKTYVHRNKRLKCCKGQKRFVKKQKGFDRSIFCNRNSKLCESYEKCLDRCLINGKMKCQDGVDRFAVVTEQLNLSRPFIKNVYKPLEDRYAQVDTSD